MDGLALKYFIFKKLIDKLPIVIKDNLHYQDSDLINYISFDSSSLFVNKDKYQIYDNFRSPKYNDFIVEVIINLSIKNDYEKLLFVYGILVSDYTNKYFNEYLSNFNNEESKYRLLNMIDLYISKTYEIDLNDELFKNYTYYNYMDELIHSPMIRIYNFLCSNEYFKNAYKKMNSFYQKNKKIKSLNKEDYIFPDEVLTSILNNERNKIKILNKEINYDIDQYIDYVTNKIFDDIKGINEYLFEKNDTRFREIFKINKDKKI